MNLSISPGKNNVGAYINDINLKSLDKDQATEKYWGYVNGGENPNDLKIVWQDDPRYPTLEPKPGFVPPPS